MFLNIKGIKHLHKRKKNNFAPTNKNNNSSTLHTYGHEPHVLRQARLEYPSCFKRECSHSYLEIARDNGVSGAAVHQRVQRLTANKVIVGSKCLIDPSAVGFNVVAYLGICAMPGTDIDKLTKGPQ